MIDWCYWGDVSTSGTKNYNDYKYIQNKKYKFEKFFIDTPECLQSFPVMNGLNV